MLKQEIPMHPPPPPLLLFLLFSIQYLIPLLWMKLGLFYLIFVRNQWPSADTHRHGSLICLLLFRFHKNMSPLSSQGFTGVHGHLHIDFKNVPVFWDCGICGFVVYSYICNKTDRAGSQMSRRDFTSTLYCTICRKTQQPFTFDYISGPLPLFILNSVFKNKWY